jgi:hypothetical protein
MSGKKLQTTISAVCAARFATGLKTILLALFANNGLNSVALAGFWLSCFFNNMARFVFRFVFGLFFPQERIPNNFSALFSGLFSFVFGCRSCIFNNFSGLFFKKRYSFLFFGPQKARKLAFSLPNNARHRRLEFHLLVSMQDPRPESSLCFHKLSSTGPRTHR